MIVGLILVGSFIGAVFALAALIIGQSIWMALLIYSGTDMVIVLAGAVIAALRTAAEDKAVTEPYALVPPQRG